MAVRSPLLVLALLTASCGAKVVVDEEPTGGGGAGGAPCGNAGMPVPPELKVCSVEGDCTILIVGLDCCGTPAFVGVATQRTASFKEFEARCNPELPPCGCEPGPAHTDDGGMTMKASAIYVSCDQGQCTTHVQ
jgi:hypothetical protein